MLCRMLRTTGQRPAGAHLPQVQRLSTRRTKRCYIVVKSAASNSSSSIAKNIIHTMRCLKHKHAAMPPTTTHACSWPHLVFGSGVLLYLKKAALWPAWPSSRKSFTRVSPLTICSPSKKVTLTSVLPCGHSVGDTAAAAGQQSSKTSETPEQGNGENIRRCTPYGSARSCLQGAWLLGAYSEQSTGTT
jgi:hypothetical protein